MPFKDYLKIKTFRGQSARKDNIEITPVSQTLFLNLPFYRLVWSRPVAVLVSKDGTEERLAIVDVTKLVQIVLLTIGAGSAILGLIWSRTIQNRD